MIKNYTKCVRCIHDKVCAYKLISKEIEEKMNGHLDNICMPEDIFQFTFECKQYELKEEINKKENPWS